MKVTLESIHQELADLKEDNREEHKSILEQTKKTNGCVTDIQAWRFTVKGQMDIIKFLLASIVIPIVLFGIFEVGRYVLNQIFPLV